jgi:hypothetical protein
MKKQILAAVLSAMLLLGSVVPAFAQGEVTVTGGTLSVTPAAITFNGVTLNGQTQNDVAGATTAWTATDPTGTGIGWSVTISATDFLKTGDATKTIPVSGFEMTLLDTAITTVAGNAQPVSSFGTAKALGATQTLVTAAAGTGMGTYGLLPTFTLDVPADTYAGDYVSTVTVSISSAPE